MKDLKEEMLEAWGKTDSFQQCVKIAEKYAKQKWNQACEEQQLLIINSILEGDQINEFMPVLKSFAENWKNNLAPKPKFKK